jgi:alpha-beta hydrolase superfamily lysophospholipase
VWYKTRHGEGVQPCPADQGSGRHDNHDHGGRAPEFRVPLLILHGTADTFTSPAASRQFWERAGAADKTYKTSDGAYHNLFVETNREEIYDDIAAWIGARS